MMNASRRAARAPARLAAGLLLPAALMLSACGSDSTVESREGAAGEILPGSASDAMIPLDSLRSQAPLAPRAVGNGGASRGPAETTGAEPAADAGTAATQGENQTPRADANATPAAE